MKDGRTPLNELNITDLIRVSSPDGEGEVLACVLFNAKKCYFVPYEILEGKKRGHFYLSPNTMLVRREKNNSHKIPPIPLFLFNYWELPGSNLKETLENGYNTQDEKKSHRLPSNEYQLQLL